MLSFIRSLISVFALLFAAQVRAEGLPTRLEFVPQVSIVTPSRLDLFGESYHIPYSDHLQGIPTVSAGISFPMASSKTFEFLGVLKAGYGYKSGSFSVISDSGLSEMMEIRLHSIPVSLSAKVQYPIPGVSGLKLGFSGGIGMQFLFQNADQGKLNQSFLFPCAFLGPTLSFVDFNENDFWFQGFTFGVTFQQSIASRHEMRGFSIDLGANIIL